MKRTRRLLLGYTLALFVAACSAQNLESAVLLGIDAPLGGTVGWEGFTSNRGIVGMLTRAQLVVLSPLSMQLGYTLLNLQVAGGLRGNIPLTNICSLRLHGAVTCNAYGFPGTGDGMYIGVGGTSGVGCAWRRTDLLLSGSVVHGQRSFNCWWLGLELAFHR